eukprot:EC724901.1.p1 GENE.EC724901.1~~EC724901.1.p1  ORF type:complete len:115 (+),score=9.75 EC724901.1:65-409(+)
MSILDIPQDVLVHHVLRHLQNLDLLHFSMTCKQFHSFLVGSVFDVGLNAGADFAGLSSLVTTEVPQDTIQFLLRFPLSRLSVYHIDRDLLKIILPHLTWFATFACIECSVTMVC